MALLGKLFFSDSDRVSDQSYRRMAAFMRFMDRFGKPQRILDRFGIADGMNVVDFGCGPARYVQRASQLAGTHGLVFAVDIHELAIEAARQAITQHSLKNVRPVLLRDYATSIADGVVDVIYALDMFHMVKEPSRMLAELARIARPTGVLYLGDGHQLRGTTRRKLAASGLWRIVEENRRYLKCGKTNVG